MNQVCLAPGCGKSTGKDARLCDMHYQRIKLHGSLDGKGGHPPTDPRILSSQMMAYRRACSVPACDNTVVSNGMCGSHRRRVTAGKPLLSAGYVLDESDFSCVALCVMPDCGWRFATTPDNEKTISTHHQRHLLSDHARQVRPVVESADTRPVLDAPPVREPRPPKPMRVPKVRALKPPRPVEPRIRVRVEVGQRFGYWTAVAPAEPTSYGHRVWLVRCELCGNTYRRSVYELAGGHTSSCKPCSHNRATEAEKIERIRALPNMVKVGDRFGVWVIEEFVSPGRGNPQVRALCTLCQRRYTRGVNAFREGRSKSCRDCYLTRRAEVLAAC